MKAIRNFMKKCPYIYALLGLAAVILAVQVLPSIVPMPSEELKLGLREVVAAIFIFLIFWLTTGTRDVKPCFKGLGYGFKIVLYVFIVFSIFTVTGLFKFVKVVGGPDSGATLLSLLNYTLAGLFVGIVEEFTFRGMIFGGLARCFGHTRKSVIWAALISSFIFGFIHVSMEVFTGQIKDVFGILQVVGKTLEAGVFGFAFALIYIRTRNIWVVVVLHSINDYLLFLGQVADQAGTPTYIMQGENLETFARVMPIVVYAVFSALLIPALVKTVRELKNEEEPIVLPLDDEFIPRKPV